MGNEFVGSGDSLLVDFTGHLFLDLFALYLEGFDLKLVFPL